MPEDSDTLQERKSPQQGAGRREIQVWAICHVGRVDPAVKIFDAWTAHWRDISWGSRRKTPAGTINCHLSNECK